MNNSQFLVTGASGFVGRALCNEIVSRGYSVKAVIREGADFNVQNCETVRVPKIAFDTDWKNYLHEVTTIIHLAARVHVMRDDVKDPLAEFRNTNVFGTEKLARSAAASGVKRLIYVSSVKVNGEETDVEKFSESDGPSPNDPYGISKWEAEQVLERIALETGLEVVVVRPPLIYGEGVRGNFLQMLNVLAKGVPLPLASVHNLRSLVYVGNFVDALIACAIHPAAAGQKYLVDDGQDISTPDLLRLLGEFMARPARLFICPPAVLKLTGCLIGKSKQIERLLQSLRIDSSKIRRELSWTPPFTLQQGLQVTAEWYRNTRL